jgi:predicted kinase
VATVHLICGGVGAGKSTYAEALAKRSGAFLFAMDEWMVALFHPDRPPSHGFEWALERMGRCEKQMWSIADPLLARGVSVVFDVGLLRQDDRDRWRMRAAQSPGTPKLHYLDVDLETRRERVRRRNAEKGPTFAFVISDAMFDYIEGWFEPPTDDELYEAMIVG